ncbi:MAG: tRNA (N6-threonylcarbamoyladenosine(37)-N6)-methyltransferase TrmO [Methanomicrobiales archaeon]|nr:tRNA (N6-threonylcarbamoyladenosine(37)-N6)-methyltransferase TrmO [Methanomicrobiales archaeon]
MKNRICFGSIGVIHTPFTVHTGTPVQSALSATEGRAEVFPEYAEGLADLEGFSHIILVYHFHRSRGFHLAQRPLLDPSKNRGIFAIRHYRRPNPIGISIVRIRKISSCFIEFTGADMLDGSPLLDIKPFIGLFDNREDTVDGWFDTCPRPLPGEHHPPYDDEKEDLA